MSNEDHGTVGLLGEHDALDVSLGGERVLSIERGAGKRFSVRIKSAAAVQVKRRKVVRPPVKVSPAVSSAVAARSGSA